MVEKGINENKNFKEMYGIKSNKTIYNYIEKYKLYTVKKRRKIYFDLVELRSKLGKETFTQVEGNYTEKVDNIPKEVFFTQEDTELHKEYTQLKVKNNELSTQLTAFNHIFQEKEKHLNYIIAEKIILEKKVNLIWQEIIEIRDNWKNERDKITEINKKLEIDLSKRKIEKKYLLFLIWITCLVWLIILIKNQQLF